MCVSSASLFQLLLMDKEITTRCCFKTFYTYKVCVCVLDVKKRKKNNSRELSRVMFHNNFYVKEATNKVTIMIINFFVLLHDISHRNAR